MAVNNGGPPAPKLPKILTIAVAPNGEVYLHFAQPFMTAATAALDICKQDAWNTAGCQCQLFRIKGGSYKTLTTQEPSADNLECIDATHYANQWQTTRNSVFQFDSSSNVYYPGSPAGTDGGGKQVIYRRTQDGSATTEMINSNIQVQDYMVTSSGGMFYTGNSGGGGGGGGSGGFFRYVSSTGTVREIARNWWNFVFEPSVAKKGDQAIFFGPDPTIATTATWNSACLFNFDPSKTTASESIGNVITCGADIWSWINMSRAEDKAEDAFGRGFQDGNQSPSAKWKTEFQTRCESSGQIFAGGGSQISAIKQDSAGTVYVIGNVRKKNKGAVTCSLSVKGAHCLVKGIPWIKGINDPSSLYSTKTTCSSAGGTWVDDKGACSNSSGGVAAATKDLCLKTPNSNTNTWHYNVQNYNDVASTACFGTSTDNIWDNQTNDVYASGIFGSETETQAKVQTGWWNCKNADSTVSAGGGDGWTSEYQALAKVNPTTKTLVMLSGTSEQAGKLWIVQDVAYFSTYNTALGKYYLKRWDTATSTAITVADNFEAYNVSQSPSDAAVFYDGLNFADNTYSFGTMLIASPYTRTAKTGLTGTVKTIVILPK